MKRKGSGDEPVSSVVFVKREDEPEYVSRSPTEGEHTAARDLLNI